jgi:hypothetical protein
LHPPLFSRRFDLSSPPASPDLPTLPPRSNNASQRRFVEVDLHGKHVGEALEQVEKGVLDLSHMLGGRVVVRYITGRGSHSGKAGSQLKPALLALLRDRGVQHTEGVGYVDVVLSGE